MSLFSEIEKTIARGFHRFAERMFGPADSNELLLLHRAILAEVEGKVQVVARGRRVFPFARVLVTLVSADRELNHSALASGMEVEDPNAHP